MASTYLEIGSVPSASVGFLSLGTLPSLTGDIRTTNGFNFTSRNPGNTGDAVILNYSSGNNLFIGDQTNIGGVFIETVSAGAVRLRVNGVSMVAATNTGVALGPDTTQAWINLNGSSTGTAPSGGASTTVTPAGYLNVLVAGTARKLAYYNNV